MMFVFAILCSPSSAWEGRKDANGAQLAWAQHTIPYVLNPEGAHGLAATAVTTLVTAATHAWTDEVYGDLRFRSNGQTTASGARFSDDTNIVYFEDNWTEDPSLLAVTYLWSNADGNIMGFDMALNSRDHEWAIDGSPSANDLLNTLSHEFGHAIGIDHSPTEPLATMYAESPVGETQKRDLHEDDIDAVVSLYAGSGKATDGEGGCSQGGPQPGPWSPWIVAPLLSLFHRQRSS